MLSHPALDTDSKNPPKALANPDLFRIKDPVGGCGPYRASSWFFYWLMEKVNSHTSNSKFISGKGFFSPEMLVTSSRG